MTLNGQALTARTTPDIAYNAAINGGVLIYTTFLGFPAFFIIGGTSAGSPQWASIIALANQCNANHSQGPLGFINPRVYLLGQTGHDITLGNNQMPGTPVGFNATTGWDASTGWGTPNVANFVPALVGHSCP